MDSRQASLLVHVADQGEILEVLDLELDVLLGEDGKFLVAGEIPLLRDSIGGFLGTGGDAEPVGDVILIHAILDGGDAAAAGVTADDDVFDLEMHHAVFEDCGDVDVVEGHDVGDIAMDKHRARLGAGHLVFADAGIGAADPEHLGLLPQSDRLVVFLIGLEFIGNELAISLQQLVDHRGLLGQHGAVDLKHETRVSKIPSRGAG